MSSGLGLAKVHPALAMAAGGQLAALSEALEARSLNAGDTLYRQGEASDFLSIVAAGRLAVTHDGQVLGTVAEGSFLGEVNLTLPGPATATVTAVEASTVWTLSLDQLETLEITAPDAASAVWEISTRVLSQRLSEVDSLLDPDGRVEGGWRAALARLLAPQRVQSEVRRVLLNLPPFHTLEEDDLHLLDTLLWVRTFPAGTDLVRQGARDRDAWFLLSGLVEVLRQAPGGDPVQIAVHGPGSWLGLMSLVGDQPRAATCRALEPTRAASLSHRGFTQLSRRPRIRLALQRCVADQLTEDYRLTLHRLRSAPRP